MDFHRKFDLPKNLFSTENIILYLIYLFINSLMVWKYSEKISLETLPALLIYLIPACLIIIFSHGFIQSRKLFWNKVFFFSSIAVISAGLAYIMAQFDPAEIDVGRYPAINDWLTKLTGLEFPYDSSYNPSGFPILFILAWPFYLVGDTGLMQIICFIIFSMVVYYEKSPENMNRFYPILLLILSPIFLFEVVVRSELFSNMVIVLLFLAILDKRAHKFQLTGLIFSGIMAGLILSTRGIVLFIYIIYIGYIFKGRPKNLMIFTISAAAGFVMTLVPFYLWNSDYFINYGPFAVQMSYGPVWLIFLGIIASGICARYFKTSYGIYAAITGMLFFLTLIAFTLYSIKFGLVESVLNHKFDISYFCFSLPFLLIALLKTEKSNS